MFYGITKQTCPPIHFSIPCQKPGIVLGKCVVETDVTLKVTQAELDNGHFCRRYGDDFPEAVVPVETVSKFVDDLDASRHLFKRSTKGT